MRESRKETLDALGLEGGWRCLMDGVLVRLDTGVAKGSVAVVGRVAVVSAVQHACSNLKLEEEECCHRRAALRCRRFYLCGWSLSTTVYPIKREKYIQRIRRIMPV
jgi:hypothetical protein